MLPGGRTLNTLYLPVAYQLATRRLPIGYTCVRHLLAGGRLQVTNYPSCSHSVGSRQVTCNHVVDTSSPLHPSGFLKNMLNASTIRLLQTPFSCFGLYLLRCCCLQLALFPQSLYTGGVWRQCPYLPDNQQQL